MKLTRIAANEFLSFSNVSLSVNSGLTAITGPNGSGKTSLARAVDLAVRALRAQAANDWSDLDLLYGEAGRFGASQWSVTIDMELEKSEISLLDQWIRGCLLNLVGQNNDTEARVMCDLVLAMDDRDATELFARGSLVVSYDSRISRPWAVSWVGAHDHGIPIHLSMDTNVAARPGPALTRLNYAWELRNAILQAQQQRSMPQGLNQPLPEEFKPLSVLDSARRGGIDLILRRMNSSNIEPAPIRYVLDLLGIDPMAASHKPVGAASVVSHLLEQTILVVDNERRQPIRSWAAADLTGQPDLASGDGLALALFQDKNSAGGQRARFEKTRELFAGLVGDDVPLDVMVSIQGHDDPRLVLTPAIDTGRGDVPLHLSGAGRSQAAHLAALLAYDSDVLVLDEPATNLSTSAQRRVVSALAERTRRGKQTVLITHSSPLVPTNLQEIVRLRPNSSGTEATRLGDQAVVRGSADLVLRTPVRDALFAAGVLMTEGETELAALKVWLSQTDPTLEQAGVLLVDVGSDSAFVKHMRLFDALGVPWAALADGPAFKMRFHHYDATAPNEDFEKARKYWSERGIHTVAKLFGTEADKGKGEFEEFLKTLDAQAWAQAEASGKGSKPRTAMHFTRNVRVPQELERIWANVCERFGNDLRR